MNKPTRQYRYYDLVMVAFVTVLLCSNVIGAAKVAQLRSFTFGAGVLFFPISYIFGDVLTEVYGFARARKVVWAGFGAVIFASLMSYVMVSLPAFTCGIVIILKRAEGEDYFDRDTKFTPFSLKT